MWGVAKTDWDAETHHSDYGGYVQRRTDNYTSAAFDPYIVFDGAGRGIVNETCELCDRRSSICEGTHCDGKAFCNMACKDAYAIAHWHDHSR